MAAEEGGAAERKESESPRGRGSKGVEFGGGGRSREPVRLLPLRGVKKRRDSSPDKRCLGDHASIRAHPKVLRLLAKHDESRILFTDTIFKVNREGRPKERALLLSGIAIYVMKPETLKCGTRIEMRAVSKLTLSSLADNFCLVSGIVSTQTSRSDQATRSDPDGHSPSSSS